MGDPNEFSEPDLSQLTGDPAPATAAGADPPTGAIGESEFRLAHDRLIGLPGVVMVGEGRDEIGNPAIHVGVRTAGDLATIPGSIGGVRVLAQVIGDVDALSQGKPGA